MSWIFNYNLYLQCEDKGNPNSLDIRKMLLSMRQQRSGLVQTAEQYRFAHIAILTGLHRLFPDLFKDVEKSEFNVIFTYNSLDGRKDQIALFLAHVRARFPNNL